MSIKELRSLPYRYFLKIPVLKPGHDFTNLSGAEHHHNGSRSLSSRETPETPGIIFAKTESLFYHSYAS
jgi:hypothetical protein